MKQSPREIAALSWEELAELSVVADEFSEHEANLALVTPKSIAQLLGALLK